MAFIYLVYDLYWLVLISFLSVFSSLLVIFQFKSQFFFLFCLPYLFATGTTTFLLTSVFSTFYSYFLLFYVAFLLIYPLFLAISCLLVCVSSVSTFAFLRLLRNAFFRIFFYFFLIFVLFSAVRWLLLFLIVTIGAVDYWAINFVFDFSVDSWLALLVFLLFFMMFLSLLSTVFIQLVWSNMFQRYAFWCRFSGFFVLVSFLIFIVPADLVLHFVFITFFLLVTELVLLTRFFQIGYIGRVA